MPGKAVHPFAFLEHMNNYRIYVEKYPEFQVEARSLLNELNENLQLSLPSLRFLNVYDLFGFSEELLDKSRYSVFGEIVTDSVTDECDLSGARYIAVEYLPGQFDRRLRPSHRPFSSGEHQELQAHHSSWRHI